MSEDERSHSSLDPDQELDFMARYRDLHRDIFGNLDELVDRAKNLAKARGTGVLLRGEEYNEQLWEEIKSSFRQTVSNLSQKRGVIDPTMFDSLYLNIKNNAAEIQHAFGVDIGITIPFRNLSE